ncbi:hypothetical protein YC2023_070909 [Brassica napus]
MKKRKQSVSKEEVRIISSTTSTKASGEKSCLPMDTILEVLSRLPAKSIARCRVVSKDWGSTLCRPYFTDLFLKMSSLSPCLLFTFHAEALPLHVMSAMKKRKQCVSKEETRIISSITSTKASGENYGQIPMDIILKILSRVPAKSIARFRCVSKDWGVTLCRPYFTDLFLKMSSLSPCLLFTFHAEGKWSFFSLPESMLISDQKSSRVVDSLSHVPIDYPIRVCVPVGGLLCTKDEWNLSGKKDARMMICNPSTGGFKLLPKVKTRRRRVLTYLGYDPVEKVYKVLCMTSCERPYSPKTEQHQVLTLGTGKMNWRMIECSVSHYPQSHHNETCIDGVLYYLAVGSGCWKTSMIVCFDIRSEKLKFIVDEAFKDIKSPSTLINYKGKLGIIHHNAPGLMDGKSSGFALWVIDDMEKHIWCKNIVMFPSLWWNLVAGTRVRIIGTTGNGEILFSPCVVSIPFYIFCYNMETNAIRRVEIKGFGPVMGQKIYTFLNHMENLKLVP